MKTLLLIGILTFGLCIWVSDARAVCFEGPVDTFTCNTNPPNPDLTGVQQFGNNNNLTVNVLPGATIDTSASNGVDAIELSDGADMVTVDNGTVIGNNDGIETRFLNDTVIVTDSTIIASNVPGDAIETSRGDDDIEVVNSTLTGADDGITSAQDNDTVKIDNSTVTGGQNGVELGDGNDSVTVIDSTITGLNVASNGLNGQGGNDTFTVENSIVSGDGTSIRGLSGNDTITLKTGANLTGIINCGSDFDTINFAMEVPEDLVIPITNEILLADPAGDTLEINGLTYEWTECERLVSEVVGVPIESKPIPTLSQWGLIAMAGLIGIAGLIFYSRKAAT